MRHVFPVVAILTVAAVASIAVSPVAGVIALGLATLSIGLRVAHGRRMLGWMAALRATSALLDVAATLGALPVEGLGPELASMRTARRRLNTLARASAWLTVDTLRGNEILLAVAAYVNAFLLVDLTALAYCFRVLDRNRDDLRALFQSVGDLDAALAVASFRAGTSDHVRPEIDPAASTLRIEDAVHPLIDNPVPNSLEVEDRGVLITGPNMSGKSTFVRTVAINAVLAQTIYTTLARRYRAPVLRVRSLMDAEDDAQGGRSYYYAEVEGAKALLQATEPGTRTLVLVDELFRGTNTSERIGAGKAVLAALGEMGHIVLASTHDRELVSLLRDGFDPYHFGEHVHDGKLVFPFKLCRGPSTTRNAIALLRQAGFPQKVIADAIQVTEELERERV
jgi:DNA mismatch repair ATPase MutS